MTTFDGDTPSGESDVLTGAAESATFAEDETVEQAIPPPTRPQTIPPKSRHPTPPTP